ncbi:PDR/VanB family oxidoreductase [Undibacterium arcticum]|uniref:PDR/VanB family oxidoreductase n=1 Tax=Undibacterium arcticum TaxID=1762892 RepID=A0ABV7EZ20_9BURK
MSELQVIVARKEAETYEICSFELRPLGAHPLPSFSAGAHIDVHVNTHMVRQYSLCNDPSETHRYLIGVLRDPKSRGGSAAMHEDILVGDILTISSPKNHFQLAGTVSHSVLLAGGIGITPLLCMAERLSMTRDSFELHYCTRSEERTAFKSRIAASSFASQVLFHFDDRPKSQQFSIEQVLATYRPGTHLYCCGPKGFMDAVLGFARTHAWPENAVHYEFFAAEVVERDSDEPFEITLASTGRTVRVEKGQTVVECLRSVGVDIETSCEQGVCGTCITRVLGGVPDHRDLFLDRQEQQANNVFIPCCSRSKTPSLVLDL